MDRFLYIQLWELIASPLFFWYFLSVKLICLVSRQTYCSLMVAKLQWLFFGLSALWDMKGLNSPGKPHISFLKMPLGNWDKWRNIFCVDMMFACPIASFPTDSGEAITEKDICAKVWLAKEGKLSCLKGIESNRRKCLDLLAPIKLKATGKLREGLLLWREKGGWNCDT